MGMRDNFLSLMNFDLRLIINFSHSLAKEGRRFIRRYEDRMFWGLLSLRNKIITKTFHWIGKYKSLSMEFRIWV